MIARQRGTLRVPITRYEQNRPSHVEDVVVVEEPLEVWLEQGTRRKRLGVTMRTPGHDDELGLGLLFSEGIVRSASDVVGLSHAPFPGDAHEFNSLRVRLRSGVRVEWSAAPRERITSSACGVCGRSSIDDLRARARPVRGGVLVDTRLLATLPAAMRARQGVFSDTGGLHAAALFDASGRLAQIREDVGRHNAVDKLVGRSLMDKAPLAGSILVVSGRAGFEILQKAVQASVPVVAAVGAPSSLAVDLAREFGVTLIGFLRDDRFNVYAGHERLSWASAAARRTRPGKASRRRR